MEHIELDPIGFVERKAPVPALPGELMHRSARIRLLSKYKAGLRGLEAGQYILVLFWLDKADRTQLLVHPRADLTRPLRGVFATRSPHRPNPIGATVVKLLDMDEEEGVLTVEGLDAVDGTPVLDIKVASPRFDSIP